MKQYDYQKMNGFFSGSRKDGQTSDEFRRCSVPGVLHGKHLPALGVSSVPGICLSLGDCRTDRGDLICPVDSASTAGREEEIMRSGQGFSPVGVKCRLSKIWLFLMNLLSA